MNYDKTEMYYLNNVDNLELNSIFRCQLGEFPFKYLGLPLHDKKLLPSWQSQLLLIGGRATLLNSVLTSTPLYALSVFRIPITVLHGIDKIRRRF